MNVKGNLTTPSALSTTLTELNAESRIIKKKKKECHLLKNRVSTFSEYFLHCTCFLGLIRHIRFYCVLAQNSWSSISLRLSFNCKDITEIWY